MNMPKRSSVHQAMRFSFSAGVSVNNFFVCGCAVDERRDRAIRKVLSLFICIGMLNVPNVRLNLLTKMPGPHRQAPKESLTEWIQPRKMQRYFRVCFYKFLVFTGFNQRLIILRAKGLTNTR